MLDKVKRTEEKTSFVEKAPVYEETVVKVNDPLKEADRSGEQPVFGAVKEPIRNDHGRQLIGGDNILSGFIQQEAPAAPPVHSYQEDQPKQMEEQLKPQEGMMQHTERFEELPRGRFEYSHVSGNEAEMPQAPLYGNNNPVSEQPLNEGLQGLYETPEQRQENSPYQISAPDQSFAVQQDAYQTKAVPDYDGQARYTERQHDYQESPQPKEQRFDYGEIQRIERSEPARVASYDSTVRQAEDYTVPAFQGVTETVPSHDYKASSIEPAVKQHPAYDVPRRESEYRKAAYQPADGFMSRDIQTDVSSFAPTAPVVNEAVGAVMENSYKGPGQEHVPHEAVAGTKDFDISHIQQEQSAPKYEDGFKQDYLSQETVISATPAGRNDAPGFKQEMDPAPHIKHVPEQVRYHEPPENSTDIPVTPAVGEIRHTERLDSEQGSTYVQKMAVQNTGKEINTVLNEGHPEDSPAWKNDSPDFAQGTVPKPALNHVPEQAPSTVPLENSTGILTVGEIRHTERFAAEPGQPYVKEVVLQEPGHGIDTVPNTAYHEDLLPRKNDAPDFTKNVVPEPALNHVHEQAQSTISPENSTDIHSTPSVGEIRHTERFGAVQDQTYVHEVVLEEAGDGINAVPAMEHHDDMGERVAAPQLHEDQDPFVPSPKRQNLYENRENTTLGQDKPQFETVHHTDKPQKQHNSAPEFAEPGPLPESVIIAEPKQPSVHETGEERHVTGKDDPHFNGRASDHIVQDKMTHGIQDESAVSVLNVSEKNHDNGDKRSGRADAANLDNHQKDMISHTDRTDEKDPIGKLLEPEKDSVDSIIRGKDTGISGGKKESHVDSSDKLKSDGKDSKKPEAKDAPIGDLKDIVSKDGAAIKGKNELLDKAKGGVVRVAEMQGQFVSGLVNENEDLSSDGMRKVRQKAGGVSAGADIIGQVATANSLAEAVTKESNKLLAADFMFAPGGSIPSKAAEYFNKNGFTVGVAEAYRKVRKNPEKFMVKGSLDFDEEKIMSLINSNEVMKGDGKTPRIANTNKGYRKDYRKFLESRRINEFENKLRDPKNAKLFTDQELEVLRENNAFLRPKDLKDLRMRVSMTDKMILEDISILKASGFDLGEAGIFGTKEITAETLSRMSAKDVRNTLNLIDKKKVTKEFGSTQRKVLGDLEDALQAKSILSQANEKLNKLARKFGVLKSGVMFFGGEELMDSEMGHAISTTGTAVKAGIAGARLAKSAVTLGGQATTKFAGKLGDTFAPDLTADIRQTVTNVKQAPSKTKAAVKKKIKASVPGQKVGDGVTKIKAGADAKKKAVDDLKEKLSNTFIGKAMNRIGTVTGGVFERVKRIASAPFKLLHTVSDLVKRKVLTPILVICLVILGGNILIAVIFGGAGGNVSAVITTILSTDEQFKDYQALYDKDDHEFESTVNGKINGNASTPDLKGSTIRYGINKQSKTLSGYENKLDPSKISIDLKEQYVKGVTVNYYYDGSATSGISSNIEDCLSAMTVIMQQTQSEHHQEALELLDALYRSTHSYNAIESALYPCSDGDYVLNYKCNEYKSEYPSTTIRSKDGSGAETTTGPSSDLMKVNPWTNGQKILTEGVLLIPNDPDHQCVPCRYEDPEHPENWSGCSVVDSPFDYPGVTTEEYVTVDSSYYAGEKKRSDDYLVGYKDSNPAIHSTGTTGKKKCFHNEGSGSLILWDPLVNAEENKHGDLPYESATNDDGETYFYREEEHGGEDDDDYCDEVPVFGSRSDFSKLLNDLKDGSLDEDYSKAKFDVSEVPSWLLGENRCDNWGVYDYKNYGINVHESARNDYEKHVSGTMGIVFYCKGHDHYGCEHGHDLPVCYGHTDLTMSVSIGSLNKIFEMGGVPVIEAAGTTTSSTIYGIDSKKWETMSDEEKEAAMEAYEESLAEAEEAEDEEEEGGDEEDD